MEIKRWIIKEIFDDYKNGVIGERELITNSNDRKYSHWNIPIKIIIPNEIEDYRD